MMVGLIQENYTEERTFRIVGEEGEHTTVLSSSMLRRGEGEGMQDIEFDVSVQVQRSTPYTTLYRNELALQLLGAGVLQPQEALSMMSFEGKDRIVHQVRSRQG